MVCFGRPHFYFKRRKRLYIFLLLLIIIGYLSLKIHDVYTNVRYIYFPVLTNAPVVTVPLGAKTIGYGTYNFGRLPWYNDEYGKDLGCSKPCVLIPEGKKADGVLFSGVSIVPFWFLRKFDETLHPDQTWLVYTSESPVASFTNYLGDETSLRKLGPLFNVLDSYEPGHGSSSIGGYGSARQQTAREQEVTKGTGHCEHLETKTDLVVGMISACDQNSGRIEYIQEMKKHIQSAGKTIQVYGKCLDGENCESKHGQDECKLETIGKRFKFYLAFENARCRGYITEKYWYRSLRYDMVPIVNGGLSKTDYERVAPPNSYIHVDDFNTAEDLVKYLLVLDSDDTAYNKYFKWKESFVLDSVNLLPEVSCPDNPTVCRSHRYCRFCDILHNSTWDKSRTVDLVDALSVERKCRPPEYPLSLQKQILWQTSKFMNNWSVYLAQYI